MFKLILLISLAVYAICLPLDKSVSNNEPNDGASAEIQPALTGHAAVASGNLDRIGANGNGNDKRLTKRETSSPEKEETKSSPPTTTAAPSDAKERKTRDTADKSDHVKEDHVHIETPHKKSDHPERPKRQLSESREYANSGQGQQGQQGQQSQQGNSSQQGQQGQFGQMGQSSSQNESRRGQNNFEHRRTSRSAGAAERATKDAN